MNKEAELEERLVEEIKKIIQSFGNDVLRGQRIRDCINLEQSNSAVIEQFKKNACWGRVSTISSCTLSDDFFDRFQDKVFWWKISSKKRLSLRFIEKFQDKIFWNYIFINTWLVKNNTIKNDLIKLYEKIFNEEFNILKLKSKKIKYKNLIQEIKQIISDQELSVELDQSEKKIIQEFQQKVDWEYISGDQILSERFIERFQDKVYWDKISEAQLLSERFIEKFKEKVDWECVFKFQYLSEEFIERFIERFNERFGREVWSSISSNQNLSEQFIEKFQDKVNWIWISLFQNLSEQFIEKFQDKIYWKAICCFNAEFSELFIFKNIQRVNIHDFLARNKITYKLLLCLHISGFEKEFSIIKSMSDYKELATEIEEEVRVLFIEFEI